MYIKGYFYQLNKENIFNIYKCPYSNFPNIPKYSIDFDQFIQIGYTESKFG